MAEYIEREAVIEILRGRSAPWDGYQKVKELPAADVRPVVLCRDCVMYECHEYDGGLKYVCRLFKRQMQETDFCSYGEKMEES